MPRPGLRLVVTGGIGAGKSTVARLLTERGFEVIDADQLGHEVLEPGGEAFEEVVRRWPETLVDGRIDRQALAQIVFSDLQQLKQLEQITHPAIKRLLQARLRDVDRRSVAVEISVPSAELVDEDWPWLVVDAPDDLRRQRLLARGLTPKEVQARMQAQPEREAWLQLADVVVDNSSSLRALGEGVEAALAALAE